MQKDQWVPMVLKDVEKYCNANGLSEVAIYLENAREVLHRLWDEERSAEPHGNDESKPIKLVWSQPILQKRQC